MSEARRGAVVITGASSGIGSATAALLAAKGFVVYAGVRDDAAAAKVTAAHDRVRPLRLDVTDERSIAAAAAAIDPSLPLEGVVNNAGVAVAGPLEHVSSADLRMQFEINVIGPLAVAQAFLPRLRDARGRIVFIGSISGRLAVPFIAPYSASKFALRAIADAMRIEMATAGIHVSLIEPGSVKTPIWEKGRRAHRLLWERLSEDARARYAGAMYAVLHQAQREERSGIAPETVARAILHALVARRPRAHYLVGTPARLGSMIGTLLPARLHDRFIRKAMRLP